MHLNRTTDDRAGEGIVLHESLCSLSPLWCHPNPMALLVSPKSAAFCRSISTWIEGRASMKSSFTSTTCGIFGGGYPVWGSWYKISCSDCISGF
ncbi:MAG: hypothetical protein ACLFNS_07765 [Desulfobacterales bacterium]